MLYCSMEYIKYILNPMHMCNMLEVIVTLIQASIAAVYVCTSRYVLISIVFCMYDDVEERSSS